MTYSDSGSALHRAGGNALDDILLADQVENDDRDDGEEDHRHHRAEVHLAVAARVGQLDVHGDVAVLRKIQNEGRQEVVVPDPHDLKDTDGDEGRLEHGEDDEEVGADRAAAVDGGGLLDLDRDGLCEADEIASPAPKPR